MNAVLTLGYRGTCGAHERTVWFDGESFQVVDQTGSLTELPAEELLGALVDPLEDAMSASAEWDVEMALALSSESELLACELWLGSAAGWRCATDFPADETWTWADVRAVIVDACIGLIEAGRTERVSA